MEIQTMYDIEFLNFNSVTITTIRTYNGERLGLPHSESFIKTDIGRLQASVDESTYELIKKYWQI